jgi:hypothetical protein
MVARLLALDPTIPAGRVSQDHAILFTDKDAAQGLSSPG